MKFSAAALVAGLATMVNAKAAFSNSEFNLVAGVAFNLTWIDQDGTGPFQIDIQNGLTTDLKTFKNLGSTNNFYLVFTPDSSMPTGNYTFRIIDSTNVPNYSESWNFVGSAATTTSGSSSASSTAASSTSSSVSKTSTTSSATTVTTSGSNSTTTTGTTTTSSTATTTSSKPTTTIANTNGVSGMSSTSPVALLLVVAAGLVFFN